MVCFALIVLIHEMSNLNTLWVDDYKLNVSSNTPAFNTTTLYLCNSFFILIGFSTRRKLIPV